ncbi:MAG: GldG family protein [Myxococcales bacterium]|nr:GldG family protein [Myxococcales bacterium]
MRFLAPAGLVMLLSGLGASYVSKAPSWFEIGNLVAGLGLLAAAGVQAAFRFRGFSGTPSRSLALRWAAIGASVLAASLLANILAVGWTAALDWTVEGTYTLSEQSLRVLERIDADPGDPPELLLFEDTKIWKEVDPLLAVYAAASSELRVRHLREQEAPPEALRLLAGLEHTVLACRDGRCEAVGFPSEENITNALLRLLRQGHPVVYFLLGHGEVDLASESEHGFSGLARALTQEGFRPRGWIGPAHEELPADASLVIIAAPERNLLPRELEALDRYLERGGRLLVLLEPSVDTNLNSFLERWGFELPAGIVADRATSPLLEEAKLVSLVSGSYNPRHPVTRGMRARHMTLLPGARAVIARHKPERDDQLRGLVYSSHHSWLEQDVRGALAGRALQPGGGETAGREIPVAAAGLYPRGDTEARIVVIGDRDFASNRLLDSLYNRDLLMNSVLWLAEEEDEITIRSKVWTPPGHPLTIQQTLAYFYFFAFALPEVLLLLGIHAWVRQRS